jgi:hypothetical protein
MVAASTSFQLENVDILIKQLRELKGTAIRKVYRQAIREAARGVLATSKQIVLIKSGKLQRSLKIRAGKRSKRLISVVVGPGTRAALGIADDAPGYYPAHIELGFKRGTKKFPGNRFLRDAILLERADAIRTISARIKSGIARAVR